LCTTMINQPLISNPRYFFCVVELSYDAKLVHWNTLFATEKA
jgi:hypothetical protein